MISESEKARRRRAVGSSEGSLEMEGQSLDAFTRDLNKRYVEGDLSLEEFSRAIDEHVATMAQALREKSMTVTA